MNILLVIPQIYVAGAIATMCEREGNKCTLFTLPSEFFTMIENIRQEPDLIVLDYTSFNHTIFNVYRYMKMQHKKIPVIFYNDPYPAAGRRHAHWENILNLVNADFFQPKRYRAVFKTIEECIESEHIRPYVPLLQPPRPEPFSALENQKRTAYPTAGTEIAYLAAYFKLSGTTLLLFELLYKNRDTPLSVATIKTKFTKAGSPIQTATIYALIKRLRDKFSMTQEINADIITSTGGYRLFLAEKKEKEA